MFYWRVTGALFWVKNIKVPFGIGHPHLHIKPSIYLCRMVQGSQILKQNWIILIRSRVIVILLIWVSSALGGWGGWGCPHTCAHAYACMQAHAHAHTCMHGKHDNFMQMATPIGFLGNSLWCNTYIHACACAWGHPLTTPTPSTHPPPPGGTPRISQNAIALELIKIFQFCLKIWNLWRLPNPWVGYSWVGGWVDWWGQVKSLKI